MLLSCQALVLQCCNSSTHATVLQPCAAVLHVLCVPGCSEAGRSLLAVDTNVLMERGGRAALAAWLAASDGASALLIPHVRPAAAPLLRTA
jgi:hypothetical protein